MKIIKDAKEKYEQLNFVTNIFKKIGKFINEKWRLFWNEYQKGSKILKILLMYSLIAWILGLIWPIKAFNFAYKWITYPYYYNKCQDYIYKWDNEGLCSEILEMKSLFEKSAGMSKLEKINNIAKDYYYFDQHNGSSGDGKIIASLLTGIDMEKEDYLLPKYNIGFIPSTIKLVETTKDENSLIDIENEIWSIRGVSNLGVLVNNNLNWKRIDFSLTLVCNESIKYKFYHCKIESINQDFVLCLGDNIGTTDSIFNECK